MSKLLGKVYKITSFDNVLIKIFLDYENHLNHYLPKNQIHKLQNF